MVRPDVRLSVSQSHNKIYPGILFHKHKRERRSHGHRKNQKVSHHFNIHECGGLVHNSVNCLHEIKHSLFSLPLPVLRSIDEEILQLYYTNNISEDTYYLISEIAFQRLYKPIQIISSEPKRYFMKILFKNKGIDSINIGNILHNKLVRKTIPPYFDNLEVPVISYKYTNSIRNNIINYNDTISNLDLTEYENGIPSCNCDKFKYCYAPHMDMSLRVILTLLIIKSLDHWYQKDQNIGNKTLSTGTLTKES